MEPGTNMLFSPFTVSHLNHISPKFMPTLPQECLQRASHKETSVISISKNVITVKDLVNKLQADKKSPKTIYIEFMTKIITDSCDSKTQKR